jgi:hypothetical protein
MMDNLQTLRAVLPLAHGKTIGGEPAFVFPEVLDVLALCTKHEIAVLGVEMFKANPDGYSTEGISVYDIQRSDESWPEFVARNNSLAVDFVEQNRGGDDHFYLLTASSEAEYPKLSGNP